MRKREIGKNYEHDVGRWVHLYDKNVGKWSVTSEEEKPSAENVEISWACAGNGSIKDAESMIKQLQKSVRGAKQLQKHYDNTKYEKYEIISGSGVYRYREVKA